MSDEQTKGAEVTGTASRDRQREETRRRVYQASIAVFRRDGVAAAKIDDIVKLAGVSRGTFYFHFPTKDDVLAELLAESETRTAQALSRLPTETPLVDVLDAMCDAIAVELQADPKLFADMGMVALRMVSIGQLTQTNQPARAVLAARFRLAAERGELNGALAPEILSDAFLANVFLAAIGWVSLPAVPLGQVLRMVTQLFLNGARGVIVT